MTIENRELDSKTPSTESISFRLEEDALYELREIAKERKISLNSLVAQILEHYLTLGVYDRTFGFFSVSVDVLELALSGLSDDEVRKIAGTAGARIHKQILMYLYGKVTKESIIDYLDVFGNRFATFRHFRDGRRNTLTVYHGINRQFSLLYYDITKSILLLGQIEAIEGEKDINEEGFSIELRYLIAPNNSKRTQRTAQDIARQTQSRRDMELRCMTSRLNLWQNGRGAKGKNSAILS